MPSTVAGEFQKTHGHAWHRHECERGSGEREAARASGRACGGKCEVRSVGNAGIVGGIGHDRRSGMSDCDIASAGLIGRRSPLVGNRRLRRHLIGRQRIRFSDTSLVDRFAQRVISDPKPFSNFSTGISASQQAFRFGGDLWGHHRTAAYATRAVESVDPLLAILRDAAKHAVLGDSESADDLCLGARVLPSQLSGEHPKGSTILFRMLEDRLDPTEVRPLTAFANDADAVIDGGGTWGIMGNNACGMVVPSSWRKPIYQR